MAATLLALAAAFGISLAATPVMAGLARRWGVLDRPEPRKVHRDPIPLLGGVAIYLGFVLPLLAFRPQTEVGLGWVLLAATVLLVSGILDDLNRVGYHVKIVVAIPLAALVVVLAGGRLPLPAGHELATAVASFVWVVGVTSAFSILDHMDGLCAGVAAVASAFFLALALAAGQPGLALAAALMVGATVGFLRWNFNPARIFMGDGGAMFLGFIMAVFGLELDVTPLPAATAWMVPMLVLGVPLFDSSLVTVSRSRRGLVPFTTPGKDHASHRLTSLGLATRAVVLSLYALGAVFGLLAVSIYALPVGWSYALAALIALAVALGIGAFERAPYEQQERIQEPAPPALAAAEPRPEREARPAVARSVPANP